MTYRDLFTAEQLAGFAKDVQDKYNEFLVERETSKDDQICAVNNDCHTEGLNNDFFEYQADNPIKKETLDAVFRAFVFACNMMVAGSDMPAIEYEKRILKGGKIEWSTDPNPKREANACWGHVHIRGTSHGMHTHSDAALAGTIYLQVSPNSGDLMLLDPRGPMPPFDHSVFIRPEEGLFVIFPGTLIHGVQPTAGDEPRISISCNYPGNWDKFTHSKTVWGESEWEHKWSL